MSLDNYLLKLELLNDFLGYHFAWGYENFGASPIIKISVLQTYDKARWIFYLYQMRYSVLPTPNDL